MPNHCWLWKTRKSAAMHYNAFLERLKEALTQEVQPFWAVDDVKVAASVNPGDAVEPRIKQRVEAAITPKADLFVADTASDGMFGPFLPLIQRLKAGMARTLYGVVNSKRCRVPPP